MNKIIQDAEVFDGNYKLQIENLVNLDVKKLHQIIKYERLMIMIVIL